MRRSDGADAVTTNHLVWVDLETTGLDPDMDDILEVGACLTTPELKKIDEFTAVVEPYPETYRRMMADPVVVNMHEASGLLADLQSAARRIGEVDEAIVQWLEAQGVNARQVVLAGSGVASFDRPFIAAHMPELAGMLNRQILDVAVVRHAWKMWAAAEPVSDAHRHKTHRALDDVRAHLEEARSFRTRWREPSDG